MTPLCFIDTETTGVHPGRQVWEIAMIRRDDHGELESSFFVQVDLSAADPFGLNVGRFYERHPSGRYLSGRTPSEGSSRTPRAAAETVARLTHGAHLVGAVPNFDAETLEPLLRAHGWIPAWHYHLIDVENLAVGWLLGNAAGCGMPSDLEIEAAAPPWKSDELSRHLGVEVPSDEERHTALGDARWAMRLYDVITTGKHA